MNGSSIFQEDLLDSFILHIPHSSVLIPDRTGYDVKLLENENEKLTDHLTDIIFNVEGINQIKFPYSRVFCDVERFPNDNDEPMAKFGRGFYYTNTDDGDVLREHNESHKQIVYENYYKPHHEKLFNLCEEKIKQYGSCTIIDCHSFPDIPFKTDLNQNKSRPDICLGVDDFHTPKWMVNFIVQYFKEIGFTVEINNPYEGTIIPLEYYKKNKNVYGIMIEINRNLYMKDGIQLPNVSYLNNKIITLFSQMFL
ncbi:MAG: N-formylglutamate amidohydrolase [bacterium]